MRERGEKSVVKGEGFSEFFFFLLFQSVVWTVDMSQAVVRSIGPGEYRGDQTNVSSQVRMCAIAHCPKVQRPEHKKNPT